MRCTQCGTDVPDDSQFCTNCGAPLASPAEAVTPPPFPPGPAAQAPPPASPPPMAPPAVPGPAPVAPSAGKSRKALWAVIGSLVALLVVAAVVVVLVVFVFGGDDTGKAKDLLTKVDKVMTSVDSTGDSVAEGVENLMANFVEIETPEDYEEIADGIRADTTKARTQLEEAQDLYKEILDLDGVEKYKKYANAMLDFVDLDLEQIEEVNLYLDYISEQFELAVSGQTVSEQEIADTTEAFLSELTDLSEEAADLKEKAADIRSDNKL